MRLSTQEWAKRMRQNYKGPMVAVDIIIEYLDEKQGEGVVLIEREFEPYGIAWPGGFVEKENTAEAAIREAFEETGLEVIITNPEEPFCVQSDVDRDPREHIMSVTYIAKGYGIIRSGDDAKTARYYSLQQAKELLGTGKFAVKDHERVMKKYLAYKGVL